ncbi:MAG TPA: P-loop NTPase [Geminicoccus sp.]|jgi:flagellar biosynthesis protein FlhG|uniref:nucleotide-binding protein n=1 Tax=Geminicoccus sp. TaxID=2024832 RepID=UPI002E336C90|nr:P-loop NTPase [Geminicoccus sp.]HEX2526932.1 P-loop NTPase [Geminicoccus sp.]
MTAARPILALASGKGGVGRTFLAVGIAQALAQAGRSVLLFDADLSAANVDLQLGLHKQADLGDVVAGRAALADTLVRDDRTGITVAPGRSGSGTVGQASHATLDRLTCDVAALSQDFDTTILDLGGGLEGSVRRFAGLADRALVVTSDEPSALADAYAFIKVTRDQPLQHEIIVNMAESEPSGQATYAALRRVCVHFLAKQPPLLGIVHRDPRVPEALKSQTPLLSRHPTSKVAQDILRLARRLIDHPERSAQPA